MEEPEENCKLGKLIGNQNTKMQDPCYQGVRGFSSASVCFINENRNFTGPFH